MTDLPIEPICYTSEEFESMIKSRNPFILSIIEGD